MEQQPGYSNADTQFSVLRKLSIFDYSPAVVIAEIDKKAEEQKKKISQAQAELNDRLRSGIFKS